MRRLRNLWRNLWHRDRVDAALDEELRTTFDLLVDEKQRAGMARDYAERAARLELGSAAAVTQQVREVRAGAVIEQIGQDLRYGGRLLVRNRLFALTAVLSLALGIGATTAIFSVANGLLMRPAAGVADPGTLVDIVRLEQGEFGVEPISYPDFLDVRARVTTLDEVFAYHIEPKAVSLRAADGAAERVFANLVTPNYFRAIGVAPAVGRTFDGRDSEQPGASPVVVLSHRYWTRAFGADRTIVGQTVRLNGHPFTVVGVAAAGFSGLSVTAPDLWIPATMAGVVEHGGATWKLTVRENGWLLLGGRLKEGVSRSQASAELSLIGQALAREFPFNTRLLPPGQPPPVFEWSVSAASPIPYGLRTVAAGFAALLMAIVSVVLVIACANLAGVLLARATSRGREIAVRAAIGAGRARVIRQLLTETALLFLLGGAAGVVVARWTTTLLTALLPAFPVPVNLSAPLDIRVVAFALVLALVSALLAGLAPALQASKADVVSTLKDDTQAAPSRLALRNTFVIAQVAFSTLLIVVAGLLARGLDRVVSVDRGFDSSGVDVVSIDLAMAGYTEETGPQFARDLLERVRAVGGVETATLAFPLPGPGSMSSGGIAVPGVTPPDGSPYFVMSWIRVERGYFATLRIPLVAGRDFADADGPLAERVAIIGERAARRFWPDKEPIGQVMYVHSADPFATEAPPAVPLRVVGVARDVAAGGGRGGAPLALYVPVSQRYLPQFSILARTADGRSRVDRLRSLVESADRNLPVLTAQTLDSTLNGPPELQLRISAAVAGGVGAIGLLLAAIGIYGVTAYAVAQRTREIGIRLSLGAGTATVIALVLRQGMRLVAIGIAIGLALGAAAGMLLARGPLSTPPPDPPLLAGAALLFTAIGAIACYVPVRRATTIRAMDALRYE